MAPFEELQSLWQGQPAVELPRVEAASLARDFARYGRRQDLINLAKFLVLAIQFVFLVVMLRHRPLALFGGSLADSGAVYFMIREWRSQRAIARLNFAAPSAAFIRSAIARLNAQRSPFATREFYLAMAAFWVGCTLMIADHWSAVPWTTSLRQHVFITLTPFAAYYLGTPLRRKRFRREGQHLIDRLLPLLDTIEGRSE